MPSFNSQIRVASCIKRKLPYLHISTVNHLDSTKSSIAWTTFTLGGWQSNPWDYHLALSSNNFLAFSNLSVVFTAFTLSGWQANEWDYNLNTVSNNFLLYKPTGLLEALSRIIVNVKDVKQKFTELIRSMSNIKYSKAALENTEAYVDANAVVPITDSVLMISWRGSTATPNDYVVIEYKDSDGVWRDISNSLNYIVSNGELFVKPTFQWEKIEPVDEGEVISYDLRIATDYYFNHIVVEANDIETNQYTLTDAQKIATEQTYFWSVRSKDNYGNASAWSEPRYFTVYTYDNNLVTEIGGVKRLLIPFDRYQYNWFVGNLPNGMYSYAIYKYNSTTNQFSPIVSRLGGGKLFIVDHNSINPPIICNTVYDQQRYMLSFDVQIYDTKYRKYNIKSIEYANQRGQITGQSAPNFDITAHQWHTIPFSEVNGNKKNLSSNPFLEKHGVFIWSQPGRRERNKKFTYNLQIGSEPVLYQKDFYYAYRNYYNDGTSSNWIVQKFDYSDKKHWEKSEYVINKLELDSFLAKPKYYGKANPYGIIMNKTKFDLPFENGMQNKFDFRIFLTDIDNPLLQYNKVERVIIDPVEFYLVGITNIILDLTNIEDEYYELHDAEIQKIINQHNNLNFYWRVQSNDQLNTSPWSTAQISPSFNIHHFEWYVKNDDNFVSSDYIVLRVTLELAEEFRTYQYPRFEWMGKVNSEIEQYYTQIERLQMDESKYSAVLQSQNRQYINYLKNRVFQIRLRVFEHLVSQGAIANPALYYVQNVHDKPIVINGQYTSDLDFRLTHATNEKDIKSSDQWSGALYKFQLDSSPSFDSQKGQPLRELKTRGRVCKNSSYRQCFLVTGDPYSCRWMGRMCPGFSVSLDLLDAADPSYSPVNPPNEYINPDNGARYQRIPREQWKDFFDAGSCPMQNGQPCAKYDLVESNMQEHTCNICGEPKYYDFIAVSNQGGYSILEDAYSQINPMGFAGVTIIDVNGKEISPWDRLIKQNELRNLKPNFVSLDLLRSQLPGEMNGDILDMKNELPIINSYFDKDLLDTVSDDISFNAIGGWYVLPSGNNDKINIVEII